MSYNRGALLALQDPAHYRISPRFPGARGDAFGIQLRRDAADAGSCRFQGLHAFDGDLLVVVVAAGLPAVTAVRGGPVAVAYLSM